MNNIIFIGPMAVGKTTIANALAQNIGSSAYSIDDLRAKYFDEMNYNHAETKPIYEEQGFMGVFRYWVPYQAYTVKRMMEDYSYSIIDFGAGFSMFEGEILNEVKSAMQPNIVILLLPSTNEEESIRILKERTKIQQERENIPDDIFEFLLYTLKHPGHRELANYTIYTENKGVQQILSEVKELLDGLAIDLSKYSK